MTPLGAQAQNEYMQQYQPPNSTHHANPNEYP